MNVGDTITTEFAMFSLPEGTEYVVNGNTWTRDVYGWHSDDRLLNDSEVPVGGTIQKMGTPRHTTREQYLHILGQTLVGESYDRGVADREARAAMAKLGLSERDLHTYTPGSIVHPQMRTRHMGTIPADMYLQQGQGRSRQFSLMTREVTLGQEAGRVPFHVMRSGESKQIVNPEGQPMHLDLMREAVRLGALAKAETGWCSAYEHVMSLLRLDPIFGDLVERNQSTSAEESVDVFFSRDMQNMSVWFRDRDYTFRGHHVGSAQVSGNESFQAPAPLTQFGVRLPSLVANSLPVGSQGYSLIHDGQEWNLEGHRDGRWASHRGGYRNPVLPNGGIISHIGNRRVWIPSGEYLLREGYVVYTGKQFLQYDGENWVDLSSGLHVHNVVLDDVTFLGVDLPNAAIKMDQGQFPSGVGLATNYSAAQSMHYRTPIGHWNTSGRHDLQGDHYTTLAKRIEQDVEQPGRTWARTLPPGSLVTSGGRQYIRIVDAYFAALDDPDRMTEYLPDVTVIRHGIRFVLAVGTEINQYMDPNLLVHDTLLTKDGVTYRMCANGWHVNGQGTNGTPLNGFDFTGAVVTECPVPRDEAFMAPSDYQFTAPHRYFYGTNVRTVERTATGSLGSWIVLGRA